MQHSKHVLVISVLTNVVAFTWSMNLLAYDLQKSCDVRPYEHFAVQKDSEGRKCFDKIQVQACIGGCDSSEISDWKFPFKKSYHPVCIHADHEMKTAVLKNCDDGAEPGTELYNYIDAMSCRCTTCHSANASCEGITSMYRRLHLPMFQ